MKGLVCKKKKEAAAVCFIELDRRVTISAYKHHVVPTHPLPDPEAGSILFC